MGWVLLLPWLALGCHAVLPLESTPPDAADATVVDLPRAQEQGSDVESDQLTPDLAATDTTTPDTVQPSTCPNSIQEGVEHCDDGNLNNLDGCDQNCRFEQSLRVNTFKLETQTDPFCPNVLGVALAGGGASAWQGPIDTGIKEGTYNFILHAVGLDDLSGQNDKFFVLQVLQGPPKWLAPNCQSTYVGTNDLDWPYAAAGKSNLGATINSGIIDAGPGTTTFPIAGANVQATEVRLQAPVDPVSKPTPNAGGGCAGHAPGEHLDPALQSFAGVGQSSPGKLCGNLSAKSLQQIPIDLTLAGNCSPTYSPTASLLDLLVSGCNMFGSQWFVPVQPDQTDPSLPALGTPPYKLVTMGTVITSCQDSNKKTIKLQDCIDRAAFSVYFTFKAGRVMVHAP